MGPTPLLPLRRKACWGIFRPKNPTASSGCEPANFGTKDQRANSRPPKPLLESNARNEKKGTAECPLLCCWDCPSVPLLPAICRQISIPEQLSINASHFFHIKKSTLQSAAHNCVKWLVICVNEGLYSLTAACLANWMGKTRYVPTDHLALVMYYVLFLCLLIGITYTHTYIALENVWRKQQ